MGNKFYKGEDPLPPGSSDPIGTDNNMWKFESEGVKDKLHSYRSHSHRELVQYTGVILDNVAKEKWREIKNIRITHDEPLESTVVIFDGDVQLVSEMDWSDYYNKPQTRYTYRPVGLTHEERNSGILLIVCSTTRALDYIGYNLQKGPTTVEFKGFNRKEFGRGYSEQSHKKFVKFRLSFTY